MYNARSIHSFKVSDPVSERRTAMLPSAKLVGFVQVTDRKAAREFYVDVLGLRFVSEYNFPLVVNWRGNKIRMGKNQKIQQAQLTFLEWKVTDIEKAVASLR